MEWERVLLVAAVGVVVAFGATAVLAGERGGPPGGGPRVGRGPGGGPQFRRPGGPGGQPGANIAAVREEAQRFREAMRKVFVGNMALAREIDRALRQLREAGAEDAELEAAAKEFAPQARVLAEKQAAALAAHYENLAKIFKPGDEAKQKEILDQLAQDIVKRMSVGEARRPRGFGPGGGFPGGRRGPRGGREGGPPGGRRGPRGGGEGRPGRPGRGEDF